MSRSLVLKNVRSMTGNARTARPLAWIGMTGSIDGAAA
jgi:hypothetical protein